MTTPAASYWLAASLQLGTIGLPGGHLVPLWPDPVLDFSLQQPNPTFANFRGPLSSGGTATARFVVPNLPAAKGIKVFMSGITLHKSGATVGTLPWLRVKIK